MHPAVFSSILAVLLVSSTAKAPSAPPAASAPKEVSHFVEVAEIEAGKISIDNQTIVVKRGDDGIVRAGMLVKLKLNTPRQSKAGMVSSTVAVAIFSCQEDKVTIMDSFTVDDKEQILSHVEGPMAIPWVKGNGTVTDAVMSQLCDAENPSLIPMPAPEPEAPASAPHKRIHIHDKSDDAVTNV